MPDRKQTEEYISGARKAGLIAVSRILSLFRTNTHISVSLAHLLISYKFFDILKGRGGSVAEWLACWTQAQKGLGSNRSRDAVG